jgi:hypothetical protein
MVGAHAFDLRAGDSVKFPWRSIPDIKAFEGPAVG